MTVINYRTLPPADSAVVRDLCNRLMHYQARRTTLRKDLMDQMTFENRFVPDYQAALRKALFVAFDGEAPIGFCLGTVTDVTAESLADLPSWAPELGGYGFYPPDYPTPTRIGNFKMLFVEETYRHLGVGHALSDRCMDWLRAQEDTQDLWVYVANGNEGVGTFYESYGFKFSHTIFNGFIWGYTQPAPHGSPQKAAHNMTQTDLALYESLLDRLKTVQDQGNRHSGSTDYTGSHRPKLNIAKPILRNTVKEWKAAHPDIELEAFTRLLGQLTSGLYFEERSAAGMLLSGNPKLRRQLDPALVLEWTPHLMGWAEVDGIFQNLFTAEELIEKWDRWQPILKQLSNSPNLNQRRCALVILIIPVKKSDDPRLKACAFDILAEQLGQKDKLITKAISWMLRNLLTLYPDTVEHFLETYEQSLPKFVIREVKMKAQTGKNSVAPLH